MANRQTHFLGKNICYRFFFVSSLFFSSSSSGDRFFFSFSFSFFLFLSLSLSFSFLFLFHPFPLKLPSLKKKREIPQRTNKQSLSSLCSFSLSLLPVSFFWPASISLLFLLFFLLFILERAPFLTSGFLSYCSGRLLFLFLSSFFLFLSLSLSFSLFLSQTPRSPLFPSLPPI